MDTFNLITASTAFLAFTSAMLCGLYFVFSNFAMRALAQLPPISGLTAMQSINRVIQNPVFLFLFLGHALGCLAVGGHAIVRWDWQSGPWLLSGASLGLIGNLVITAAFNVPLNDRLDTIQPQSAGAQEAWRHYLDHWLPWNHLRTALMALASSLFLVGLVHS